MTKYRALAISLVLITGATAVASKDDSLGEVAKRIGIAYSNRDPESPYTDKTLEKLRTSTSACLKAVDDAIAAGATLDDDVRMPIPKAGHTKKIKNKFGAWIDVGPLRDAQSYCRELAARPDVLQLQTVLNAAANWLKKAPSVQSEASAKQGLDHPASAQAGVMQEQVEPCHDAIKKAVAAGVAPTSHLQVPTGDITLDEADAKVCDALDTAAKAINAIEEAKLAALLAPYKKALKGDRLNTFIDRKMIFDDIYGPGGGSLDTPAKLVAAKAWFIVLSGDIGLGIKTVTVRRYLFSGNKLGSVTERTGCCTL